MELTGVDYLVALGLAVIVVAIFVVIMKK